MPSSMSSGPGYGGYGKVALGGYAGPPAAEQVMNTEACQIVTGNASTRPSNVTIGSMYMPWKAATVISFALC